MLSRRRTLTLLVVLCLGHVLLISAQVQDRDGGSVLRGTTFGAMSGVQRGVAAVADGVRGVWTGYFWLVGASRENAQLRGRVLELEGQLQGERARTARTNALEEALNLQRSLVAPTLAARVIAGNPLPGERTITIDRGAADGIRPNMAVIAGPGIVGRVIGEPSAHAAVVQLVVGQRARRGGVGRAHGERRDRRGRLCGRPAADGPGLERRGDQRGRSRRHLRTGRYLSAGFPDWVDC